MDPEDEDVDMSEDGEDDGEDEEEESEQDDAEDDVERMALKMAAGDVDGAGGTGEAEDEIAVALAEMEAAENEAAADEENEGDDEEGADDDDDDEKGDEEAEEEENVDASQEAVEKNDDMKGVVDADGAVKKKRGKPKDPNAPKKPAAPFQAFMSTERPKIQESNPELRSNLAAIGKLCGEAWAKVLQEEKDALQVVYDRDKSIFDAKLVEYKKTMSYTKFQKEFMEWKDGREMKKLLKRQKGNAPKRPPSGYMSFATKAREDIKTEGKGLSMGEVGKEISERWAAIGAAKQESYNTTSRKAKIAYDKEMDVFKHSEEFRASVDEQAALELKQGLRRHKTDNGSKLPQRPPSAIQIWSQATGTKGSLKTVSDCYKGISLVDREKYAKLAEERRSLFKEEEAKFFALKEGIKYTKDQASLRQRIVVRAARRKFLVDAPKRPVNAQALYTTSCESTGQKAEQWPKLPEGERKRWEDEHANAMAHYESRVAKFRASDEYKKFEAAVAKGSGGRGKGKAKGRAKAKAAPVKPEGMPDKPFNAFKLFMKEQGPKGGLSAASKRWVELGDAGQIKFQEQATAAQAAYAIELTKWAQSSEGKKWLRSADGKKFRKTAAAKEAGLGKTKGNAKGKAKAKAKKPDSMPAKPSTAIQLFFKEQSGSGKGGLAALSKLYSELGADGQKKYIDQAATAATKHAEAMTAWEKTKEGKQFARKGEAKKQRAKAAKAKDKYLGGTAAPEPPARPKNAQAMFDEGKRQELSMQEPNLGARELTNRIAKLWEGLSAEEKKPFESRAQAFKDAYQFELEAYRETPEYKAYQHAISGGKKKGQEKALTGRGAKRKNKSEFDDVGLDSDSDDMMGSDSDSDGI